MSGGPAIEVTALRKVYRSRSGLSQDEIVAVDDISFRLEYGESLAIVGESGSGKTTTARLILGLEQPTAGEIKVVGNARSTGRIRARNRRQRARETQLVFQDPYGSLDRRQTVRSCLEEVLKLHFKLNKVQRAERASELVEVVGLDARHLESLPRRLSGGQRQRVAIARALAAAPDILILDEAVAALDVSVQSQILNLLADLREKQPISYLFISHDLAVVRQVSDSIIVMRQGRIVASGPTDRILDNPPEPYTKQLINAIPRPGWSPSAVEPAPSEGLEAEAGLK